MMTHAHFLETVEEFLKSSGLTATDFGRRAAGDPAFVGRLRRGGSPTLRTVERVMSFIGGGLDHGETVARDSAAATGAELAALPASPAQAGEAA